MKLKRTFGLILFSTGVVLVLRGLNSMDPVFASVTEDAIDWANCYILGGVALARAGTLLNPVGGRFAVD